MPARSDRYSKAPRAARHESYVLFCNVLETTCAAPRERAAFIHQLPRRAVSSETRHEEEPELLLLLALIEVSKQRK
jgi:hypothetical protein